jgi:hypothetical protein
MLKSRDPSLRESIYVGSLREVKEKEDFVRSSKPSQHLQETLQ